MKLRSTLFAFAALVVAPMAAGPAGAAALVAQYQFADANNLGLDSSGFGNDLTNFGATQTAGHNAGSFGAQFDGSDVMQRLGGMTGYDGKPGFTYAAWVNLSGPSPNTYFGIISQDFGACCDNRLLITETPSRHPYINEDNGTQSDRYLGAGAPIPLNTWFYIVMTGVDGLPFSTFHQGHVYVNGVELPDGSQNFFPKLTDLTGANTYLGAGEGGGLYRLFGILDDVRIYDGALNAGEVATLYNSELTAVPTPAALALFLTGLSLAGFYTNRGSRRRS